MSRGQSHGAKAFPLSDETLLADNPRTPRRCNVGASQNHSLAVADHLLPPLARSHGVHASSTRVSESATTLWASLIRRR
eukprot:6405885-Pyramimonas_sp.AAC.1